MDAILLVGGLGTRLLPLTKTLPKPLIPLANIPFVERTVCWLRDAGATNIILSLYYNSEQFIAYFQQRALGVSLHFAVEDTPLGTGGAIKNCAAYLRAPRCFVCNGDIFTDLHLPRMLQAHRTSGAKISIALKDVEDPSKFGVIETDATGRILAFTEKPPRELARSHEINAGIYIFEREMLQWFPEGACSVEREIFPRLLEHGLLLTGYREWPYWTDLGTPGDYLQAHRDILYRKVPLPLEAREVTPGIWIGDQVTIAESALIRPPVLLGTGMHIGAGATVGPVAVCGAGVTIGAHALVEHSIIWDGSRIHPQSFVRESVLGRQTTVSGQLQTALCEDGAEMHGAFSATDHS